MQLIKILGISFFVGFGGSCSKCKHCYIDETNSQTGVVTTSSLGKKCGSQIDEVDGKTYVGPDGSTKTYCK